MRTGPRPSAVVGPLKPTWDLPSKEAFTRSSRGTAIPPFISKLRLQCFNQATFDFGRILRSQDVFSRGDSIVPIFRLYRRRSSLTQTALWMSQKDSIHSRAVDPTRCYTFNFSWTIPSHYFQFLLFPFDNFQGRKTGFASTTAVDRCVLRLSVYQIETISFAFGDYSVIRFQWQRYFGRSVTAPTLRAFGATFHNIDMINLHLALAPNSYLWSIEYWSRAIF